MSENSKEKGSGPGDSQPISKAVVVRMIQNYRKSKLTDNDTQSLWFGIKELMSLIHDNKANGVRLYYGCHDDDDPVYPGKNTIIVVATHDSKNPGAPCCEDSFDLLAPATVAAPPATHPYTGMALEYAALCPPRCNPGNTTPPPPAEGDN